MTFALSRQAELFARAKRLVRQGHTKAEAARKVGRSRDWLMRLLAQERRDSPEDARFVLIPRGSDGRKRPQVG